MKVGDWCYYGSKLMMVKKILKNHCIMKLSNGDEVWIARSMLITEDDACSLAAQEGLLSQVIHEVRAITHCVPTV